ncbi:MAG: TPM domain-containing protein [Janthinobacterium lividum]
MVAIALFGWVSPVAAESVKSMPAPTNYVNDYAGVLNESTQSDMNSLLKQLDTQAHAQVFVAVIHKIDDDNTPAEFANQLFAKWKPGPKDKDRGALLLISVEDHKYQFEIGYGLEGILPDGKTGDIGREMVPDLKNGSYDGAVRTAVNDLSTVIAQDAGVTLAAPQRYHREPAQRRSGGSGSGIFGLLFFLFILFLILRGGGRGGPGGFLSGMLLGGMLGGGRGGFGGGGGGSFGGGDDGGGGFGGGDGGSSGGGGAGGSW